MRRISGCNFLSSTSPILRCAPDFGPAGPSVLPGFFFHRPSPMWFQVVPLFSFLEVATTMQSLFLSCLSSWPIQFHLLLRISSLIFFTPVTWEIVSFRMRCGYQVLRIRLSHVNWNVSSFFSSEAVCFHASQPYNRTCRTKVIKSSFLYSDQYAKCSRSSSSWKMLLVPYLEFSRHLPSGHHGHPLLSESCPIIQTLRRLQLPLFQSLLCLLFVYSFSSLCIFVHSVSVPLFLLYLRVD